MAMTDELRGHTCTLYDSINEVPPADWLLLVNESTDLAMDRRLIAAQEATLSDQCTMWIAVVRNAQGLPVACACLCLFRVDAARSSAGFVRAAVNVCRQAIPRLLRIGVLFCGLPIPAGDHHLRIAPFADTRAVVHALHRAMQALAKRRRATLVVFKEFDREHRDELEQLSRHGFIQGAVPPMHRLRRECPDFDHYLDSLRSRYRAQIRRSMKKLHTGGFVVEHHFGAAAVGMAYSDQVHELYRRVWERSPYRLEYLSPESMRAAANAVDGDAALTILRRESCRTPVGFTFSIARGRRWHNLYSGVDYSINGEGDILFNLFYADLALAFDRKCDDVSLGQTSDAFKARLGATADPLRFFVRARAPLVHVGLRIFAPLLFPSIAVPPPRHVFRNTPPPRPLPKETTGPRQDTKKKRAVSCPT